MSEPSSVRNLYDRDPIREGSEDSLAKIARRIREGSTVLDIGCGVGALGCWLAKGKQCAVDGIESNPQSAAIARDCYRDVWEIDVESDQLNDVLGPRRYHVIVCADILEHLKGPGKFLRRLEQYLDFDGRLLISVPNVSYIGVILEILSGEFLYRDEGLLDRTHLRFFTRKSILRLLLKNGYSAKVVDHNIVDVQRSEFSAYNTQYLSDAFLREIQKNQDNIVYQFVLEAVTKGKENLLRDAVTAEPPPLGPRSMPTLYWRGRDQQYDKERSVSVPVAIGSYRQRIRFNFPLGDAHELRLHIADQPGVVVLHGMQVLGNSQALWSWNESRGALLSREHEALWALPNKDVNEGAYLESKNHDAWLIVPVSAEEAKIGNALEVELSVPSLGGLETMPGTELRAKRRHGDRRGANAVMDGEESALDLALEIEKMRNSRSWRITRPLRKIRGLMKRVRSTRS